MDILAGKIGNLFNIHSKSRDERARLLSNFANRPFELGGFWMASTEGFIQGIKFPRHERRRYRAFASSGSFAKKQSPELAPSMVYFAEELPSGKHVDIRVPYGSNEHHRIIERAIRAKFYQNEDCMEALVTTVGMTLIHNTGEPESLDTSLPAEVFCKILAEIRNEKIERD